VPAIVEGWVIMCKTDAAFAALTILLGAWIAYAAVGYGYTAAGNPGPGFFPFWVGLAIVGLGGVNVYRAVAGMEILSQAFERIGLLKTAGITAAMVAFLWLSPLIGMLVASGLMILAVGTIIRPVWDRAFGLRLVAIAIGFPIAAYVIFSFYLNVRLVSGVAGF